jgi:hypothetical protein
MLTNFLSVGKYALVDSYYFNIWFVVDNEQLAHKLRLIFWSKIQTIVFDLSTFDNYTDTLVDTDVCLDWKVTRGSNNNDALLHVALLNQDFLKTKTSDDNDRKLINVPTPGLLEADRRREIQKQIYYYQQLTEKFFKYRRLLEDSSVEESTKMHWRELFETIDFSFQSELDLPSIQLSIEKDIQSIIENYPDCTVDLIKTTRKHYG